MKDADTTAKVNVFAILLPRLRQKAYECGYALALHGSMTKDLDLLAVPWIEEAVDAECLIGWLQAEASGFIINDPDAPPGDYVNRNPEPKPHGRKAWSIHLGKDRGWLDVSVMPKLPGAIALLAEVSELMRLMSMLDPHGREDRHPEWPLDLRGDADAVQEMCACLNNLRDLVKRSGYSPTNGWTP